MVDLPGITRVPVHGQPENIYEQMLDIIMEYITPEESIILNVLSATVDFSTCESIRMSQTVDKTGTRTLAVVTKADKAPEGLLEKVTNDDVSIGLGYVCVRNRIGDKSYEEARMEERQLFENHPLLSKIGKSIVGIPVLAQKLVHIQANILSRCLPNIVKQINDKLSANVSDLNSMPQNLSSVADAMTEFMRILGSAKESMKKILIRGEYDEFPDEKEMHCMARLSEMLFECFIELQAKGSPTGELNNFLMDEVNVLLEAKGIVLPSFLPRAAFLYLLQKKVKGISSTPIDFVKNVWSYLENVLLAVLMQHSENYPQLQGTTRRAANNLIARMREESIARIRELIEMEKVADYTCSPDYMTVWNKLMSHQNQFMEIMNGTSEWKTVKIEDLGEVKVEHLRRYKHIAQEAFDMKMRIVAYWKIVLRRLMDSMALHLLFSVQNLVNKELEKELMEPHGGGIERMLEESPSIAGKRDRLKKSIKLLKESKDVVANIVDRIKME
ncbi:hypothetical protein Ancab_000335 [Ancistrocladus abbreviatus]